jgi:membrane-bound ClpP family serine protease
MVEKQDDLMVPDRTRVQTLNLISKILIASGIVLFIVGAFLILFVNTAAGLVFMLAGACDLGMSVFIFKISAPRTRAPAEGPPGPTGNAPD